MAAKKKPAKAMPMPMSKKGSMPMKGKKPFPPKGKAC